jgi:hypothetical protein
MRTRETLVCVLIFALGCAAQGSIPSSTPDATPQREVASGDVTCEADAPGEAGGSRSSPDAPYAPDVGQDAGPTEDAAAEVGAFNPATWTNIYNTLLGNMSYASNCTGEGCHSPGTQKGLDLSSPENGYLTLQTKLVRGNPSSSTVVNKLEAGDMPRGRPRMPASDLDLIKAWILAGAPND